MELRSLLSRVTLAVIFIFSSKGILASSESLEIPEIVHFKNGNITLGGELFKPKGNGPFPTVLYNHGSAPGMLNSQASKLIGPRYVEKGWAFFMPYRRGQGLSANAGPYIGDEIKAAYNTGGEKAAAKRMLELLKTDHLSDQLAALKWLKEQKFTDIKRIAVAGNSFGGIQTVFGAEQETFCAAVDASGAAESWGNSIDLQETMKTSVRKSKSPIFFIQAENDFDLSPSKILSEEMKKVGKDYQIKIYPKFGKSEKDGHSFAYAGVSIWFEDVFAFVQKHCGEIK